MTRKTVTTIAATVAALVVISASWAGTITKAHQGAWHAKQLEKQGYTCVLVAADPTPNEAPDPYDGPWYSCSIGTPDAESSSFMCQSKDARENPTAVLDSVIIGDAPNTPSLANGWHAASYIGGQFTCAPVSNPTAWTDDSLSIYDAPNTAYANPVA